MKILFFLLLLCSSGALFAQNVESKPILDFEAVSGWTRVSSKAIITDDGKYMAYHVERGTPIVYTLVVAATDGIWKKELPGYYMHEDIRFSGNRSLIYGNSEGSFQLSLPDGKISRHAEPKLNAGGSPIISFRKVETDDLTIVEVYDRSTKKYKKVVDDRMLQKDKGLRISEAELLSSGNFLLRLKRIKIIQEPLTPIVDAAKVDIWSYTDIRLQSDQKNKPEEAEPEITAILFSSDGKIEVLDDDEHSSVRAGSSEVWLIAKKSTQFKMGGYWPVRGYKGGYSYVISTSHSHRRKLDRMDTIMYKCDFTSTADGSHIGYFSPETGFYYSYDVNLGQTQNLTPYGSGFTPGTIEMGSRPARVPGSFGISLFTDKDGLLTIYDKYDIWKLDLRNIHGTKCLTNFYGKKNGIALRFLGERPGTISWGDGATLLYGIAINSKMNGLFSLGINSNSNPRKLFLESALWYQPEIQLSSGTQKALFKAKNADVLLLMKQTATTSPNWFAITSKSIQQLSFINPEKKYNWMTAEQIRWKSKVGDSLLGILYKPEDFDPSKKYPVVVHYYETLSDQLNLFHQPALFRGDIEIALLVSRGYLVFEPDILYRTGKAGQSALDCVNSGTDEICRRPYVDIQRIGIAGHSFGGFETAYIATHTDRYKAALVTAPLTDQISRYSNLIAGTGRKLGQIDVEFAQGGLGSTMWESPELYIENSPVFNLDKVKTPILMMHNDKDKAVPFFQGMEMFLGLYRMGKPAWLLQYDDNGHNLGDDVKIKKDYTIRSIQFFDHYLKRKAAPSWMLDGIAFKDKGFKQGYELDATGRTPGLSPRLSDSEYKKIEEYSKIPLAEKLMRIEEPKKSTQN